METELKVLIIDDSPPICQILSEHLKTFGIKDIDCCYSGDETLECLQENNFEYDALFIDLHMHGMDGLQLMHHLNELDYRGSIIIISALESRLIHTTLDAVSNYHLKILGSIEKPITTTAVAYMIRRLRHMRKASPSWEDIPSRHEVESALEKQSLVAHFQPVVSNQKSLIHAFECLTRLKIDQNLVEPEQFLPIIDKFDLHELFLTKLLEQAAKGFQYIQKACQLDAYLSINLSHIQLYNDGLPEQLDYYTARFGLDRNRIIIEISDSHALVDELQKKNLNRLRIHGFSLALDDYGSGYTNTKEISNLPFNYIKIDSGIVKGIHDDKILAIMLESIQKESEKNNIHVIAVGVSEPQDLITLENININLYQGYLLCRPKPVKDVIAWVNDWKQQIATAKADDAALFKEKKLPLRPIE